MDTLGEQAVRQWIDQASPTHPTLLDAAHVTGELFGFVNVPNAVWIDEDHQIVRPPEGAPMHGSAMPKLSDAEFEALPDQYRRMMGLARRITMTSPDDYIAAIEDWATHGSESRFALDPGEVLRRCSARTADQSRAAACFEIGQELQRRGNSDAAVPWFQRSQDLFADNWTYKRQAWSIIDPVSQNPAGVYTGSWVGDLEEIGPENYYVPFSG